jgi:hypothetical protein
MIDEDDVNKDIFSEVQYNMLYEYMNDQANFIWVGIELTKKACIELQLTKEEIEKYLVDGSKGFSESKLPASAYLTMDNSSKKQVLNMIYSSVKNWIIREKLGEEAKDIANGNNKLN